MKSAFLPILATVVLGVATYSIARTQPQREPAPPPIDPPRSEFVERVAGVGLVEASSENISLSAHLPGVVERVYVTAGQQVKAGDPLVKLDTRALEAALAERRSEVRIRKASVDTAKARTAKARAALVDVQQVLKFAESLTQPGSISAEELARRRSAVEIAAAEVTAAEAEILAAQTGVEGAEAAAHAVETDIARSTILAPVEAQILQLRIRPGEYAPAGPSASPWLVLGQTSSLHIRVDIDEHEAWRVRPGAKAVAQVRGNANLQVPLAWVRIEPLVVPKTSLTGASTERVDTRVMQAIYRVQESSFPLLVGQQMDVFIEASTATSSLARR